MFDRSAFHRWLGLRAEAVGPGSIEISARWRPEWVVRPKGEPTHGGILAALVDVAADWALYSRTGRGVPTIDLRVDYHRAAAPGDLTVRGEVVNFGRQISVAEATVINADGVLIASGRGVYLTKPPTS
ncbi:PaaI family thioesterase [Prauserella endophytica]|uniref:Phenylacetic acid degradation protein n=3 Tax=Pseudonocardiaceae TaxID=2070 RepID=A0A318LDD6_9PSEU|nr:phenylacetic acid degradation protein [Prauserella flavalba]TKG60824.1 PaaI family thioesterase [Prauserella endophytica]